MEIMLKGQTALVTGSSSGIGAAIAKAMAAAGAKVVVNYDHSEDEGHQVAKEIQQAGGEAIVVGADVSQEDDVIRLFQKTYEEYGTVDILVSNAGIQQDAAITDMTLKQWQMVLDVNLTGGFLCAREAVREFLRRGVVPSRSRAAGKIIFISSVHQQIPWARHVNYATAKGGILLLMKTLAQELAAAKIRVNSIAPGAIKTEINKKQWDNPAAAAELLKLIPYKRIGEPEDIGPVAVWLASDASDYITGTTIFVDGGMILYPDFGSGG